MLATVRCGLALALVVGCGTPQAPTPRPAPSTGSGAAASAGSGTVASAGSAAAPVAPTAAATPPPPSTPTDFAKARDGFTTHITYKRKRSTTKPPPVPPAKAKLERVKYRAPLGELWAYVTPDPKDGKRHPAVVWAAGGFDHSIDSAFFAAGPRKNDQSASQLRAAGIIVMYPSYRGVHDNPGTFELLYGEVDDFLAAADYLRALPYVDPNRIFLAGHSTGGTLVLLAAEISDRFRAAFALGPVTGAKSYGENVAPFDAAGSEAWREWRMREPLRYVADIRRPTFIVEGERSPNARALPIYARVAKAAGVPLKSGGVPHHDHFSVIAPILDQIARAIVSDDGTGEFRWAP